MSAAPGHKQPRVGGLARRLRPLQVGAGLQGFMLWVPVEKLFQTQIGFDAAAIAVMAAAYAAVVPLLEVPSGILADRWSRSGILMISSAAAAASALVGGLSHNVATYIVAALILGIYFAMNSGTVDSVVYDTVIEETGSADAYERWIGRVRVAESAAFTTSALAGGLLAGWTSPRLTYFLTIPFVLASIIAFSRFREPRLHRAGEPLALRRHVATTFGAITRIPSVRRVLLLAALTALLSQAIFEFGPLWLVALHAPAAAFGPYWALLVATLGAGGYLAARLHLGRPSTALAVAAVLVGTPVVLATSHAVVAVAAAQAVLQLTLAVTGIYAGRLLHDAVPSHIRAGVSSGAGTLSWMLFLPFSLGFGALARSHGVYPAGWIIVGTSAALATLLIVSSRAAQATPAEAEALEALAAATGETPGGDPRPLLTPPPDDLACRDLVRLVSDFLDGDLPPDWRASIDAHLRACDGCTAYQEQVLQTVALLEQIDALQRHTPINFF
jgi:MFS family permease